MRNRVLSTLVITLAAGLVGAPCRAEYPVLQEYADEKWVYYAPVADQTLIFENGYGKDASNAWIAIERSPSGRGKTLKLTDFWTDRRGRLHSLSVLEFQIDFNAFLVEAENAGKRHFGAGSLKVDETGVLDRGTLRIPFGKLYIRNDEVSKRLDAENAAIATLAVTDPNGAALRKKYATYLSENIAAAAARLREFENAIAAVAYVTASQDVPIFYSTSIKLTGLRGLAVPAASQFFLKMVRNDSGTVRFVSTQPAFQSELLIGEFVDPVEMTPEVAAHLKEKEAVAAKAVGFAENLCRDLLTPPCP